MEKILKNAIKCNYCGDIIVSKHTHDLVSCQCGKCSVDGGNDYLRRLYTNSLDDYEELSEIIEVNDELNINELKKASLTKK